MRLAHAFAIAHDAVLALVDVHADPGDAHADRYAIPFDVRDGRLREAPDAGPAWRALAAAIADGRTVPALPGDGDDGPAAALVCRPAPGLAAAWGESPEVVGSAATAPLGRAQANSSVVIGGRLLLKAYRRVMPGLNPDLELTAFLSEEAGFPGVPRLAGYAEAVTRDAGVATVAMLQAFVPDAEVLEDRMARFLDGLLAAPGTVSLEWATEVASDLGTLVAGLHAALATPPADVPDLAPRDATRGELLAWRADAHRLLELAHEASAVADPLLAADLRQWAPEIAARVSPFGAVAATPRVIRIHGGLHLGEVLVSDDGYRVVDFEGDPRRSIEDRRRPDSPLRDVATLLRSLDRVARAAGRRAGVAVPRAALDIDAWLERARARLLASYAGGLRGAGAPFGLDPVLLDAFEVAVSVGEVASGAGDDPPRWRESLEGLRRLIERGGPGGRDPGARPPS